MIALLLQVLMLLLLILLHDALLVFGGISLADNFFTLNLEGGLIVKKKSLQLVPSGGAATVGSGELILCLSTRRGEPYLAPSLMTHTGCMDCSVQCC